MSDYAIVAAAEVENPDPDHSDVPVPFAVSPRALAPSSWR